MRRGLSVSAILVSCLSVIAIGGCASAPEIKDTREIRLNKALLARDVANRQTDSIPEEETTVFSSEDPQALMWLKLDDVAGRHNLRWEWYDPYGKLYLTTGDYKVNTDGKYRPYNTSWHKMGIKGEKAATLPGKWQVKVFLDERPVVSREFEIKNSFSLKDLGQAKKVKSDRRKWAVIIGIERYRKSAPVQFAESDARTMRDYTPDVPCTVFFEDAEWKVLVAHKYKDINRLKEPPSLREAIRLTASLEDFSAGNAMVNLE